MPVIESDKSHSSGAVSNGILVPVILEENRGMTTTTDLLNKLEVNEINSRFGNESWTPVRYMYCSLDRPEPVVKPVSKFG